MRKVFGKIHLWLSIPIGIILSLICTTGAILVFATEISEAIYPERYFTQKVLDNTIALDKLIPMVNAQLTDNSVKSVQIPSNPKRNYVMALAEGKRVSAYVNPYTGKVVEIYSYLDSFFGKVMGLHRWLLFGARDLGRNIVGYTTLVAVLIIISGIVIWWPKTKKQLKSRLKISTENGPKRLLYDLHSSLAIYLSIGFLVLALTGLTWSFDWYRQGFYAIFGVKMERRPENGGQKDASSPKRGERPPSPVKDDRRMNQSARAENSPPKPADRRIKPGTEKGEKQEGRSLEEDSKTVDYAHWEMALNNIKKTVPEYKSITISQGSANVAPLSQYGNERKADKYSIDPATGAIQEVKLYSKAKKSDKIRGWIYSVHVGSWGGLTTKILTFLIALLAGTLPLTGYYIYYLKRKKKWQKREA
ncbi:MAG: Iron-uptake factor PiuB [Bacteroidetes bacterium]|nr:Iron-uptake factor PiuB [Bacteroidota bacterium]